MQRRLVTWSTESFPFSSSSDDCPVARLVLHHPSIIQATAEMTAAFWRVFIARPGKVTLRQRVCFREVQKSFTVPPQGRGLPPINIPESNTCRWSVSQRPAVKASLKDSFLLLLFLYFCVAEAWEHQTNAAREHIKKDRMNEFTYGTEMEHRSDSCQLLGFFSTLVEDLETASRKKMTRH